VQLSVVIRTKNEIKTLPALIGNLHNQSYKDFEIIIVDNESTDGTYEYALANATKVITITNKEFTHAKSTNLGVSAASGEFVYFTNGHSLPISPDLLTTGVQILNDNPDVAGVYGRVKAFRSFARANLCERIISFFNEMTFRKKPAILDTYSTGMLITQSCMIRTFLLRKYPFKELHAGGGEDLLWAMAILKRGYKIAFHPKFHVHHSHGGSNIDTIKYYLDHLKMFGEVIKTAKNLT